MNGPANGLAERYYGSVAAALLAHLPAGTVTGVRLGGGTEPLIAPRTSADLVVAVRRGIVGFWVPSGGFALRLRTGDGADAATAATVGMLVIDRSRPGSVIMLSDGADGLWVRGRGQEGFPSPGVVVQALAASAPEVATDDPTDAGGRVLLELPPGPDRLVPVTYTLVEPAVDDSIEADAWGVVAPLSHDEVAAVAAGMPLDIRPLGVPARLASRGDLAAELTPDQAD